MLNKPKHRLQLNGKSFSSMSNLMLLKLSNADVSEDQIYLSNNLRFLKWHRFPLKTLPSNFQAQNLFELNLCDSQINYLWKGIKDFPKLKTIKLRNSHNLIETPDFTMVPNLEMLDLKGCTRLCKVHESVGVLKSLIELNLEGCNSLRSFPSNNQGTSGTDRTVSGRETACRLLGADKVNLNGKSDKRVSNSNSALNLNDDSGRNFGVRSLEGNKFSGKEKESVVAGKERRCVEVDAGSSNASDVGPSPSLVFVFGADGVTKKAIGLGDFNVPQSNNGPFVGPSGLENISFNLVDGKSSGKSVFDPITETIDLAGAEHKLRKKSGTKSTNGKKGGTVEEECTMLQWGGKGVSSRSALWEKEGGGGFLVFQGWDQETQK
ncbi:hypothetical protein LWI29_035059 [Acer saccharum]|uniref:Uncharacterized protein n=1 Tax=Acer saccharum TaxID=4024 RepID=A0AA39SN13_ACESA|nr:hypothetical protein LWI29_035059 [Acer saccharum]